MTDRLFVLSEELLTLVETGRPDGLPPHRAATAAAEEVGECIGAHNKIADGRVTSTDHFRSEWAQAMLMLVILGRQHLELDDLALAMEDELVEQRRRWAERAAAQGSSAGG